MSEEHRIAQIIRMTRKKLRMNQAEFADAIGASQGSVSKWESAREVPRFDTLEKIKVLDPEFPFGGEIPASRGTRVVEVQYEIFDYVASAPIVGYFFEGEIVRTLGESLTCSFPLSDRWKGHKFAAYLLMKQGRFSSKEGNGPVLLIVAMLSRDDRVGDIPSRTEQVLIAYSRTPARPEQHVLMSIERSPDGLTLWPISRKAKSRIMPITVKPDGQLDHATARAVGLVVCTLNYVSEVDPEVLEPPAAETKF